MKTKFPKEFYFKKANGLFNDEWLRYYAVANEEGYLVSYCGAKPWQWSKESVEQGILNGEFVICISKYKWQSVTMGNIVENFGDVLKQVWESLTKYYTLDIKWKYNKNGF